MKESSTHDLDRIDRNILRALQKDGRLANADLAKVVNASAATCHRRTQRLFELGYIANVRAQIDPVSVGLGALVMVGVVLDRSTPESFTEFEKVRIPRKLGTYSTRSWALVPRHRGQPFHAKVGG